MIAIIKIITIIRRLIKMRLEFLNLLLELRNTCCRLQEIYEKWMEEVVERESELSSVLFKEPYNCLVFLKFDEPVTLEESFFGMKKVVAIGLAPTYINIYEDLRSKPIAISLASVDEMVELLMNKDMVKVFEKAYEEYRKLHGERMRWFSKLLNALKSVIAVLGD